MYIFDPVDRTPTTLAQPALNEMSENLLNLIKRIYQLVVKLFKARGSLPSTVKNQVVQGVVQNIAKNNRTQFQAATDNVKKETPALTRNVTGAAAVGAAFGCCIGGTSRCLPRWCWWRASCRI